MKKNRQRPTPTTCKPGDIVECFVNGHSFFGRVTVVDSENDFVLILYPMMLETGEKTPTGFGIHHVKCIDLCVQPHNVRVLEECSIEFCRSVLRSMAEVPLEDKCPGTLHSRRAIETGKIPRIAIGEAARK